MLDTQSPLQTDSSRRPRSDRASALLAASRHTYEVLGRGGLSADKYYGSLPALIWVSLEMVDAHSCSTVERVFVTRDERYYEHCCSSVAQVAPKYKEKHALYETRA